MHFVVCPKCYATRDIDNWNRYYTSLTLDVVEVEVMYICKCGEEYSVMFEVGLDQDFITGVQDSDQDDFEFNELIKKI